MKITNTSYKGGNILEETMNDIISLTEIDYWGGCPKCRKNDGCFSVGPEHWYVCHKHKTKWHVGSNLFSSWKELSNEQHALNDMRLMSYKEVEPLSNPEDLAKEDSLEDESLPI